jgi:alpha-glucosidase
MRAHSVIDAKNKEPWEYGEEFTAINRETINLRYRLLPYVYNVMYQSSVSGVPAMRPLLFEFPEDQAFSFTEDCFMFGDDLLIAPVLQQGATEREVDLPQGEWYDYWTNVKYHDGEIVTVEAPIHRIPIFVRAGAVVPTQQVVQYAGETPMDTLTFTVYPASQKATSVYYEDDGRTYRYESGDYVKRSITHSTSSSSLSFLLSEAEGRFAPPKRTLVLQFVNIDAIPRRVVVNKKADTAWNYDPSSKALLISMGDTPKAVHIEVLK